MDEDEDTRAENKQKYIIARRVYFWLHSLNLSCSIDSDPPAGALIDSVNQKACLHVFFS